MFVEKILESKHKKIKQYPVNSNRASDLGHPCLRYHVYNRTRWNERSLHDVGLQMVFDMGNDIERIALRELEEANIKVIEQQRSFEWKEYQITGHIDGMILGDDRKVYPFDIKSCSPYVFKTINTIDDLKNGKYIHLKKYPVQLNLYLLMSGNERGLFLFKDKVSGAYKEIWMDIDYQLGEDTLKKCEAINGFVSRGELPDPIGFSENISGLCPFRHICIPDHVGKEVEVDTGELSEMLKTLYRLESSANEWEEVNKEISRLVEGKEKILAGDYFITGKWIDRKGGSRYWKKSIIKV
jgi:hypothetical protein